MGSPLYMAPEICKELNYNEKVDVWAVGIVTHILLTGCPPFYGKTKPDIQQAIQTKIPGFGRVEAKLSQKAKDFCLLALAKDPNERPSIAELLEHPFITSNEGGEKLDLET